MRTYFDQLLIVVGGNSLETDQQCLTDDVADTLLAFDNLKDERTFCALVQCLVPDGIRLQLGFL